MKSWISMLAFLAAPSFAAAQNIQINDAYLPLAPPGTMTHAAYMTIKNTGPKTRSIVGISAKGYEMAHLHKSKDHGGVASMTMVHQLDIAPGKTVIFEPGAFHVMLMNPSKPQSKEGSVQLELKFANGQAMQFKADIVGLSGGS